MDQATNLRKLAEEKKGAAARHSASIITVASGKGGTGKTFFCVNFAIALAEAGKRVMIIDADFGLSNVDVMLGAKPKYNLLHVINGACTLKEAMCQGHGGIQYISGGSGLDELLNVKKRSINALLSQLSEVDEELDFIIFDSGAGINEHVKKIICSSDELILMLAPEPPSLVDAFALVKSVKARNNCPPMGFVINRCDNMMEAIVTARNFRSIVKKYLGTDMEYLGYLLTDKNVPKSIKMQTPIKISYPDSFAVKDIEQIVNQFIVAEQKPKRGGLRTFLERVIINTDKD